MLYYILVCFGKSGLVDKYIKKCQRPPYALFVSYLTLQEKNEAFPVKRAFGIKTKGDFSLGKHSGNKIL